MITNQEAVQWAIQRGLISVRPPLSIDPDAYKRRLADQRRPKPPPSGPTTGFNPQRADSRNKPPEQAGAGKPRPKKKPSKLVGSGRLVRRLEPNEITGIVVETNVDYERFGQRRQYMAVQWPDGTRSSEIPMIVIAKPSDALVFTIRPA